MSDFCTAVTNGPIMSVTMNMPQRWNDNKQEKAEILRKTFPTATFPAINPTRTTIGWNSGFHGKNPATIHLRYGNICFKI
jgi:hypothetical protein